MATKLAGYSEREREVLQDCRRKSAVGALKWALPSLVPLWVGLRSGFLPRIAAAPLYTTSFVVFSFLGAMSHNDSCIESILSLEDSELAAKLRKSLPRQSKRYDQKRARESTAGKKQVVSSTPVEGERGRTHIEGEGGRRNIEREGGSLQGERGREGGKGGGVGERGIVGN